MSPCQDSVWPLWHHDSTAMGITLAFPVSLLTSFHIDAIATCTSKFGAENTKTERSGTRQSLLSPANEAPSL